MLGATGNGLLLALVALAVRLAAALAMACLVVSGRGLRRGRCGAIGPMLCLAAMALSALWLRRRLGDGGSGFLAGFGVLVSAVLALRGGFRPWGQRRGDLRLAPPPAVRAFGLRRLGSGRSRRFVADVLGWARIGGRHLHAVRSSVAALLTRRIEACLPHRAWLSLGPELVA